MTAAWTLSQTAAYSPEYWGGSYAVSVQPSGVSDQVVTEFDRYGNKLTYPITGMEFNAEYVGIDFVDTINKVIFSGDGTDQQAIRYNLNESVGYTFSSDISLVSAGAGNQSVLMNIGVNTPYKIIAIKIPELTSQSQLIVDSSEILRFSNMINNYTKIIPTTTGNGGYIKNGVFTPQSNQPGGQALSLINNGFVITNNGGPWIFYDLDGNAVSSFEDYGGYLYSVLMFSSTFLMFIIGSQDSFSVYDYSGHKFASLSMPDGSSILGINEYNEIITTSGTWNIVIPALEYIPLQLGRNYCHNYSRGVPVNFGGNLVLPKSYNVRKRF